MFRLLVLLCAAIFVTLLIAGDDKGQLRPGLAAAVASGEGIVVLERNAAPPLPAQVESSAEIIAADLPVAEAQPATAAVEAMPVSSARYTPARPMPGSATPTPAPVFTLSALPTTRMEPAAETPALPQDEMASDPSPVSGDIWYVTARAMNVREAPTTDSPVMGRLTQGDAVTVSFIEGSQWAQVRIEGDGLEGYVALRFLSPDPQ